MNKNSKAVSGLRQKLEDVKKKLVDESEERRKFEAEILQEHARDAVMEKWAHSNEAWTMSERSTSKARLKLCEDMMAAKKRRTDDRKAQLEEEMEENAMFAQCLAKLQTPTAIMSSATPVTFALSAALMTHKKKEQCLAHK